jgi:hypothetical protein
MSRIEDLTTERSLKLQKKAREEIETGVRCGDPEAAYSGLVNLTFLMVTGGSVERDSVAERRNAELFAHDISRSIKAAAAGRVRQAAKIMRIWSERWSNCDLTTAPGVLLPKELLPVGMFAKAITSGLDDSCQPISERSIKARNRSLVECLGWCREQCLDPSRKVDARAFFSDIGGINRYLPGRVTSPNIF